jgi:exopolyphosphatase/guanosine-5'-triphosphate,3'-diphosphate pyrophosphatase
VQLFHQLAPVHGLAPEQRVPLELAALLHDTGRIVHTRAHHKHGEYLVRHADIPGLGRHQQDVVACLVRYHGKATPEPHHRLYRSLAPAERLRVRQLAALLRIAVALDADNTQAVRRVEAKVQNDTIWLRAAAGTQTRLDFSELRRKARYFEQEFGVHVRVGRMRRAQNANGEHTRRNDERVATRSAA